MHPKSADDIIKDANKIIKDIDSLIIRNSTTIEIKLPVEVLATLYEAKASALASKNSAIVSRWNATGHLASALENISVKPSKEEMQSIIHEMLISRMSPELKDELDRAMDGMAKLQKIAIDGLKG